MKLNNRELHIIATSLGDREKQLGEMKAEWEDLKFEDLGSMKNLFANEESFEMIKSNNLKNWTEEMQEIENLCERIEEDEEF